MIDPALRDSLPLPRGPGLHTVVLQWQSPPDLASLQGLGSKRERLEKLQALYRDLKAPVMDSLRASGGLQIQDMPATGEAIVTAPADKLNVLLAESGVLAGTPEVRVLPNATITLP